MNVTPAHSTAARGWLRLAVLGSLALVLGALVVAPLLVPAALYWSFRPSGELQALRRGLAQSAGADLECQMELALRPTAFSLVRAGAVLADLPPEARGALRAIRGAEFGLYQVASRRHSGRNENVLAEMDRAMAKRGWERVVGVIDRHQVVAVFAPQTIRSHRDLSLAVLVSDGSQVVVASVRGNPEALVELALQQARQHPIPRLAMRR